MRVCAYGLYALLVGLAQIFLHVHGYAVGSAGKVDLPGQTTIPVTADEMAQIKDLKLAHFCNLAMCHLKQGPNWQKAHLNCSKALDLDPKNVKALFRRGKCNAHLGRLDEAKEDLERALVLQPDNKDAIKELRSLRVQFATQRRKEQRKFAGMFDRLQAGYDEETAANNAAAMESTAASVDAPSVHSAYGAGMRRRREVVPWASVEFDGIGEPLGSPQHFEPCIGFQYALR